MTLYVNTLNKQAWPLLFLSLLLISSCQKMETVQLIDPATMPSELSQALQLSGDNIGGTAPESTSGFNIPHIIHHQNSASVTNDNILYIPINVSSQTDVERILLQVSGADNHWIVPAAIEAGQNNHVFQMGIPDNVLEGQFELGLSVMDRQGAISATAYMSIKVEAPVTLCEDGNTPSRIEGTDGLTIKKFNLGSQAGVVTISYQMYTKPDRMDIFYNGQWVTGTGNKVSFGSNIPASQCHDGTEGYVSGEGSLSFEYDPAINREVSVYLSGCYGGTEWYFDIQCAEDWFGELPDCPCTYDSDIDDTQEMGGTWHDNGTGCPFVDLQDYHYGAHYELRWSRNNGPLTSGQQCTYTSNGKLITGGLGAGSPDRHGVGGCSIDFDHVAEDVDTWEAYSCISYLKLWPANQGDNCSENVVYGIDHMEKMVGSMPCPQIAVLIKGAKEADDDEISTALRNYLLGLNPSLDDDAIVTQLKAWKEASCEWWDDDLCELIQKAIDNMGG